MKIYMTSICIKFVLLAVCAPIFAMFEIQRKFSCVKLKEENFQNFVVPPESWLLNCMRKQDKICAIFFSPSNRSLYLSQMPIFYQIWREKAKNN